MSAIRIICLSSFDDPRLAHGPWNELLERSQTNCIFLTWEWQSTWWECFRRPQLLLLAAEREGRLIALAPCFADGGMVFFVGSGGSDYLDFLGDVSDANVLDALLNEARERADGFVGFRFYQVPDGSSTGQHLKAAAGRLGLSIFDEGELPAPRLGLAGSPEAALAATRKKGLLRDEQTLRRDGELGAGHFRSAEEVLPQLAAFFEQHIARRAAFGQASIFARPEHRSFYERLTQRLSPQGWLRFTRLDWKGRPIAFHFGSCYRGRFFYGIPTFDVALARRSPGSVLLRQLLLAASEEGATVFDFGIGDEAYKHRFATAVDQVRTWGLYPLEGFSKVTAAAISTS